MQVTSYFDLLTYNRLGRTEVELKPMSLKTILEEVKANLEVPIQNSDAQITILEPLSYVMGHYATLLQVVEHLLSNAIKFVEPAVKPMVRVWTEEQKEYIRLFIQDNGIGLAQEHQEQIFRLFERHHDIGTYSGTGIGLAIVKRGVTRMGGSLGMESTPGQGSLFWVDLKKEESNS